jgi:uncharacterized membrane protein YqiK
MTASPFIDTTASDTPAIDLDQLDALIAQALAAKQEAERQKAIYDSLRDQICATVKDLGETKLESASGKVRLKESTSGWTYSEATEALAIQLKAQQQIEKKNGTAQAAKVTISADVFPL